MSFLMTIFNHIKWVFVLVLCCMANICFSSPVLVYLSEVPGPNDIRLVTGKVYWDNQTPADTPLLPVGGSYIVGPLYKSVSFGGTWWGGSPNADIILDCQGYTYKKCSEEWIKRFGPSPSFTMGISNSDPNLCLGFGVGLGQKGAKQPFPGSTCSSVPPETISCAVNTSALNVEFHTLESNKYDGERVVTKMDVKCTGGTASVSVVMGDWNLSLTNNTTANFTISAGDYVVSKNSHLTKIDGEVPVFLNTVLRGEPKIGGAFSGSTFIVFNYD